MKVIVDLLITVNSLILVIAYQMFQQLQKAVNKMIREVFLLICGLATISIVLLDKIFGNMLQNWTVNSS